MTKVKRQVVGEVYGRLLVKDDVSKNGRRFLVCVCDCGATKEIAKSDVIGGKSKSCGCLRREVMTKHASIDTKLYSIWDKMKGRCCNANNPHFEYYGGRGITVCEEWHSYINFENDMRESFELHLAEHGEVNTTIDRIDVNSGYSKGNCRWATRLQQVINRRTPKSNTSGYVGVSYISRLEKWKAQCTVNGKTIHLGVYAKKEDAIQARKKFENERETYYDKPIH